MRFVAANASGFVPASHEDPRNPGVLKRVIAIKDDFQTGHVQMLNWAILPQGSSFQLHYHEDMQETFVLLKGTVEMKCGGIARSDLSCRMFLGFRGWLRSELQMNAAGS